MPVTLFATDPGLVVTAKALVAGTEAGLSGSSNWSVTVVPEAAPVRTLGAVTSSVVARLKFGVRLPSESWSLFEPGWM